MQPMISIVIVSREENDRKITAALLARYHDFTIASMGADGYYAVKLAKEQRPDIIITDYRLSDIEISDLAPVIKRYSPATSLIVLYSGNECYSMVNALKAGVSGCVPKEEISGKLAESVRCVYHGGLYLSQIIRNHARQSVLAQKPGPLAELSRLHVTNTELCIFKDIALGYTDLEIARDLNMSVGSLRNCIYHAKRKTGLKNRTQISVYALLSGMINSADVRKELLKASDASKQAAYGNSPKNSRYYER
jgi:two-component system response regulator NreC